MSDAALGAVAFIARVSQLLGPSPGRVGRPGEPQGGGRGGAAGVRRCTGPFMARLAQRVGFAFLYLAASVGTGVNNTVHNSYLSDAYPTEGRGRIFSWHNLSDPLSQTVGILIFGCVVTVPHNWRCGPHGRAGGHPARLRRSSRCASPTRVPTSPATSSRRRGWTSTPSRRRRPGCCSVRR